MLSISGLTTGILNAHNLFTLPALAPFILNILIVISVAVFTSRLGIVSMAIGTMAGSVFQLIVQLPQIKGCKNQVPFHYRF